MTIYNCSTAEPDSIKWNINDNGNIENPKSGLAVSGFKGKTFSPLTVEKNTYASSQGWRLSNNTMPVVTPIIGFESLCMQACGGNTVEMLECSNTTAQKWKLYPDGTVRPYSATSNCLTSKSSQDVKTLVRAMEVMLNDGYSITIIAFLTQLKNLCWKLINRRR